MRKTVNKSNNNFVFSVRNFVKLELSENVQESRPMFSLEDVKASKQQQFFEYKKTKTLGSLKR